MNQTRHPALTFTVICVAIACSMILLGLNAFHGCQQPLAAQHETTVRVVLLNQSIDDLRQHTGPRSSHQSAAAAVSKKQQQSGENSGIASLLTSQIPFQLPVELGLPSDSWRPHIYSKCIAGMPQGYAPCLNYSNLLHADELVYPDFRIRMPFAVNEEHSKILHDFIKPRFRIQGEWAYYLNQHGRNFVFGNTSYENNPPPQWAASCCMCEGTPAGHTQFTPSRTMAGNVEQEVMFAASPDSNSFQHWRDRTALMISQASHLLSNATKFIVALPKDHTVATHWQLLANASTSRLIAPGAVQAHKFIYSCDTPLLHPYLVQRMSETMLTSAGIDAKGVPWDQRKVVLLIGRNKDTGVRNGHERRWNNYDQCKTVIEQLLQRRGQGERLDEWDLSKFASLQDIMKFWNTQVRGALGVHGSGLMNVHWASPQTTLFEIWPVSADKKRTRGLNVFWEQAALKGVSYWWFHAQGDNSWNVDVDCELLAQALDKGLTNTSQPMLEQFYQGTMWSTR